MILLGLTGSVAAVLAPKLIMALKRVDMQVEVIMTDKVFPFVSSLVIREIANHVYGEKHEWVWGESPCKREYWLKDDPVLHIELRNRATDFVIAPLTANTMGKLASGVCDNLLTSVARAWGANRKIIVAPAMNTNMWEHPITAKNLETLRSFNYDIVMPQSKNLACGTEGMGAMANISDIISRLVPYPTDKWWFPLTFCYGIPVDPHPGSFGFYRKNSRHGRHNGIDLYTNDGEIVRAVEPGKIVSIEHFTGEWDNSPWWNNTDCIMIEGSSGVVCYGEVKVKEGLKIGDYVRIGEYIASVERVIKEGKEHPEIPGHSPSMLHLELYAAGTKHPAAEFVPELKDPTPFILDSYKRIGKEVTYADYKPEGEIK